MRKLKKLISIPLSILLVLSSLSLGSLTAHAEEIDPTPPVEEIPEIEYPEFLPSVYGAQLADTIKVTFRLDEELEIEGHTLYVYKEGESIPFAQYTTGKNFIVTFPRPTTGVDNYYASVGSNTSETISIESFEYSAWDLDLEVDRTLNTNETLPVITATTNMQLTNNQKILITPHGVTSPILASTAGRSTLSYNVPAFQEKSKKFDVYLVNLSRNNHNFSQVTQVHNKKTIEVFRDQYTINTSMVHEEYTTANSKISINWEANMPFVSGNFFVVNEKTNLIVANGYGSGLSGTVQFTPEYLGAEEEYRLYQGVKARTGNDLSTIDIESAGQLMNTKNSDWEVQVSAEYYMFDTMAKMPKLFNETNQTLINNKHYFSYINVNTKSVISIQSGRLNNGAPERFYDGGPLTIKGVVSSIPCAADCLNNQEYLDSILAESNIIQISRAPWQISISASRLYGAAGWGGNISTYVNQTMPGPSTGFGLPVIITGVNNKYNVFMCDTINDICINKGVTKLGHTPAYERFDDKTYKFKAYIASSSSDVNLGQSGLVDVQAESNEIILDPAPWYVKLDSYAEAPNNRDPSQKIITFNFTANKSINATSNPGSGYIGHSPYAAFLVERSTGDVKKVVQTSSTPSIRSVFNLTTGISDNYQNYVIYIAEKAGSGNHLSTLVNIKASTDGPYITSSGNEKSKVEKVKSTIAGGNLSFNCPKVCFGDPINPSTGELFENDRELEIDSIIETAFVRSFSTHQKDVLGSLGLGNRHNFDMNLINNEDSLIIVQENGSLASFQKIIIDPVTTEYANMDGSTASVYEDENGINFKREMRTFTFDDVSGRLLKIKDQFNNEINLSYSGDKLSSIAGPDFTITVNWNASDLISSVEYLNQTIEYEYDTNNRLTAVNNSSYQNLKQYEYDANNRITKITHHNGGEYINTYDGENRVVEQRNPLGGITSFAYAENSTIITFPDGAKVKETYNIRGLSTEKIIGFDSPFAATYSYEYDSNGNILKETLPLSGNNEYRYDNKGKVLYKKDNAGRVTRYIYDQASNLTELIHPNNTSTKFFYNSSNLLIKTINANGSEGMADYNAIGQMTSVSTNHSPATTNYVYRSNGLIESTTNRLNGSTSYTYDSNHNLTKVESPLGKEVNYSYNVKNQLLEIDTLTGATEYEYDAAGRIISTSTPLTTSSIVYDVMDNVISTTVNGLTTTYEYDTNNRIKKETDPKNNVTEYIYDIRGFVSEVKFNGDKIKENTYNIEGTLVSTKDSKENVTSYLYNTRGEVVRITPPNGNFTNFAYDNFGRLIKETSSLGKVIDYSYDIMDNLISKKTGDETEIYEYDYNSNLIKTVHSSGKEEIRSYDAEDRLIYIKDYFNNEYTYEYDLDGKILKTTENGTKEVESIYDANDRLSQIDYDDFSIVYTYDNKHRIASEAKTGQPVISYTYDSKSNVTARGPPNEKVEYTYNNFNEITKVTYPGGIEIDYEYEDFGGLSKVKLGSLEIASYEYDTNFNNVKTTFGNGVEETRGFNSIDGLVSINVENSVESLLSKTINYDQDNFISQTVSDYKTEIENESSSYTYNNKGRLTGVKNDLTNVNKVIESDSFKNNTKAGTNQFTYSSSHGALDSALINSVNHSYTHDSAGNRTSKILTSTNEIIEEYSWTSDNKLATFEKDNEEFAFSYDSSGLLSTKTSGSETEEYVWDYISSSLPVMIEDGDYFYIYGTDNSPFAQIDKVTEEIEYLHGDERGSKVLSTDEDGLALWAKSYDEYGNVIQTTETTSINSHFAYSGEYLDEDLNLYNMRARWYDASTSSFISVDPLSTITGERYSYGSGNSIMNSDPTGLFPAALKNLGKFAVGAIDGVIGFPLAAGALNAISPGLIDKCDSAYAGVAIVASIGSMFIPGGGIGKAGVSIGKAAGKFVNLFKKSNKTSDINFGTLPVLEFSRSRMPNISQNIENAWLNGHPRILTYIGPGKGGRPHPDAAKNRKISTQGQVRKPGLSIDEYPFASSKEGGYGAEVMAVPVKEQSIQGGTMSSFYKKNKILAGSKFGVRIIE